MKKGIMFGILIFLFTCCFCDELPKSEVYLVKGNEYTIEINYIKEYKQAVFVFKTSEELFDELTASSLTEEQIEVFQKFKGYYGYVISPEDHTIRFGNNIARYIKTVTFIYTSK